MFVSVRAIDLTQEIYQGMPVFPLHQPTFIFENIDHARSKAKIGFEFATNNLLINEHGPTHSDASYEYDPQGRFIDDMPLHYFYGAAICLNVTHIPAGGYIRTKDLEEAVDRHRLVIHGKSIVLLHTGHYERAYGSDEWLTHYTGLSEDGAEWLVSQGVLNIGVDAPSIDNPDDERFSGHLVCRRHGITNTENLCNLGQVAGREFFYVGLPLRIRGGTGSPIRAVAFVTE